MNPVPPHEGASLAVPSVKQLARRQVLTLWAAAAAPLLLLAWIVAPAIISKVALPAVVVYWLVLMPGMAWQIALALWVIRRQTGRLDWAALRDTAWLGRPRDPRTGAPRLRILWRALPYWPLVGLILLIAILAPVWLLLARRFGFEYYDVALLRWPAYANLTELASPEFAGQWPLLIAALLGWIVSAALAEEFLFRGVLLPRMAGAFRRGDWAANALLFALYHLYQYWLIPFRLLEGLILARKAKRYASLWPPVAIRAVEAAGLLLLVGLGVGAKPLTVTPPTLSFPKIDRQPAPLILGRGTLAALPAFNPAFGAPFQVDVRGADLSTLDLRGAAGDLAYADFDTRTVWPPAERLPVGFDPAQVMALGRDPGLGVWSLHARGITGRGVGVAIIDQPLLVEHAEYADRLRWYEEIPGSPASTAAMHGPAVASLAVGKTLGVAPEADLYYIGGAASGAASIVLYSHDYAQAIRRVVQINAGLPADRKIRAISISSGWLPWIAGYHDVVAAVAQAEAAGILVVNVDAANGMPSGAGLMGLGRPLLADPNRFESYEPGVFWAVSFYAGSRLENRLLVPMDTRTMASPAGSTDYAFSRIGGGSWVPPYVVGLYALAAQADPTVTPQRFWAAALRTARTIQVQRAGQSYSLGAIVDPVALINELK